MDAKLFLTGFCFLLALTGCLGDSGADSDDVIVRGGMPENTYTDEIIEGDDLGRYEGQRVHIRIGSPEPVFYPRERTGWGTARIAEGSFRILFPSVNEGLYKQFVLFIDRDGDGRCTAEMDVGFKGVTGGGVFPYTVEEWQISPMERTDCEFFHAAWKD